jgi:hypothetical protein
MTTPLEAGRLQHIHRVPSLAPGARIGLSQGGHPAARPQLVPEFGDGLEIWQKESLARKWGFPEGLHETVGTGLSDETAATLPIPKKDELLYYLRSSYERSKPLSKRWMRNIQILIMWTKSLGSRSK